MDKPSSIFDMHFKHTTHEDLQAELRVHPWRLEEKKAENTKHNLQSGNTPLMSSAEFGNVEICEFLLSVGANIEAKNEVSTCYF